MSDFALIDRIALYDRAVQAAFSTLLRAEHHLNAGREEMARRALTDGRERLADAIVRINQHRDDHTRADAARVGVVMQAAE